MTKTTQTPARRVGSEPALAQCGDRHSLAPQAAANTSLLPQAKTDLVVNGCRRLFLPFRQTQRGRIESTPWREDAEHRPSTRRNRKRASFLERHGLFPFQNFVLEASPLNHGVFRLLSFATGQLHIGSREVHLRLAISVEVSNGRGQVRKRDGEPVPFCLRFQR